MTTAKPPARYSAMESARAGDFATPELHHPSGHDPAPAVAGCPRRGWSDPDRRIRKPLASARPPVLILDAEAPLWSQPTQATPVVGTASGRFAVGGLQLPPRRAFSNYATAFGLTSISEVRPP